MVAILRRILHSMKGTAANGSTKLEDDILNLKDAIRNLECKLKIEMVKLEKKIEVVEINTIADANIEKIHNQASFEVLRRKEFLNKCGVLWGVSFVMGYWIADIRKSE